MVGIPLVVQSILASSLYLGTWGYIPALPANDTGSTLFHVSDNSSLSLTWNPNGGYGTSISYQQVGNGSAGISKGALIRIQEEDIHNNDTTTTPWIAFINCDKNSTDTDMDVDIFTMVSYKGAIAALLYSNTSDGCSVNEEYLSGEFDQLFDIFTTKSAASAKLIQSQYQYVNLNYSTFNSGLLNDSRQAVTDALPRDAHNNSPYLVAALRSFNATMEDPTSTEPVPPIRRPSSSSGANQSLAMIILYVIVSVVSALFVIVILSGAIRAFRHPERYGPRLYHPGMDGEEGPQTRAAGLTRAILDTFPIVKFGRHHDEPSTVSPHELKGWHADATNPSNHSSAYLQPHLESQQQRNSLPSSDSRLTPTPARSSADSENKPDSQPSRASGSGAEAAGHTSPSDIDPAAIGTETCPICIVDFEEGDDLRILPCEGKHRFHVHCVDPWLLELSSSCPICREDFQALEDMAVAAGPEDEHRAEAEDRFSQDQHNSPTAATSRFSRYMHFAQRRRRSQRDANRPSSRHDAPARPPAPYTDY